MRPSWQVILTLIASAPVGIALAAAAGYIAALTASIVGDAALSALLRVARRFDWPIARLLEDHLEPRTGPRAGWSVSLLVEADEHTGVLRPSVWVHAPASAYNRLPAPMTVSLDVIDPYGVARAHLEDPYSWVGQDTEIALDPLRVAEPSLIGEVASWHWSARLSDAKGTLARTGGPLASADQVNPEAELLAPELV